MFLKILHPPLISTATLPCNTQHLDELKDNNPLKYKWFLRRYEDIEIEKDTTSTIFVFLSPQCLVHNSTTRNVMLCAATRHTLHLIVMDEMHLHVQHGKSFREECGELAVVLFKQVFQPPKGVRFLSITATLPTEYVPGLSRLTTLEFSQSYIYRGTAGD